MFHEHYCVLLPLFHETQTLLNSLITNALFIILNKFHALVFLEIYIRCVINDNDVNLCQNAQNWMDILDIYLTKIIKI